MRRAIGQQVGLVAAALERGETDVPLPVEPVAGVLEAFYREALPVIAGAVVERYPLRAAVRAHGPDTDPWLSIVEAFLQGEGATRVTAINETTRQMILDVLSEHLTAGPRKAANELRKRWDDLSKARADRIARTEILGASNKGGFMGASTIADDLGLDLVKEWIWSGTERKTHAAMDGVQVGLHEAFIVDGEAMQHPGDFAASAKNVINCGCTLGYEVV